MPSFEAEFRLQLSELARQWASHLPKFSMLYGTECGQPADVNFLPCLGLEKAPNLDTSTFQITEHASPRPIRLQNSSVSMLPSRSR